VQRDVADQGGVVGDIVVCSEQRGAPLAEGEEGHGAIIIQ
jgi:hypothetical protein